MKKTTRIFLTVAALFLAFTASVTYRIGTAGWEFILEQNASDARPTPSEPVDLTKLKVLGKAILYIKDHYVEPERFRYKEMLKAALDEVQRTVAELVVSPSPGEDEDNPASVTVTVGKRSRRFDIDRVENIFRVRAILQEIFGFVQPNLTDPEVKPETIEWAAIRGILSTLDPHSTHLSPEEYGEMQVSTRGKFGGLGIVIAIRDGELTIISPIEDTPAARAGLKARDRIVRIDDESTVNMPLTEAVEKLRGDVGTAVDIYIRRKGWAEPRKYHLIRDEIRIKSVASRLLEGNVGYIKIKNFQQNTTEDLETHLRKLKAEAKGNFKGLVLDLRNDPGGLLDQAIRVADTFLETGTIVATVGQANTLREEKKATAGGTEERYPMVVLVNTGSASASEIVAGALKNNDRALVMGQRTFGKGSVQVLYELLDDSALKLTIAQYLTPGGISIQSFGITPDVAIEPVSIGRNEVDLVYDEAEVREADLESHLTSNATADEKPAYVLRYYQQPPAKEEDEAGKDEGREEELPEEDPNQFVEDFEIRASRDLILKAGSGTRGEMLARAKDFLATLARGEEVKVQDALRALGVNWDKGPAPAPGTIRAELSVGGTGGSKARAGDRIKLTARVTNQGSARAHRLRAVTESPNEYLNGREFVFGALDPGETRTFETEVAIPREERSRFDPVTLAVHSDDGKEALAETTVLVAIEERKRPRFGLDYRVADSAPHGDGAAQPGEDVRLLVTVHNLGEGPAEEAVVSLSSKSGKKVYLRKGREKVGNLAAGGRASVSFEFKVSEEAAPGETLDLSLSAFDTVVREWVEEKLALRVAPPVKVEPRRTAVTVTGDGVPLLAGAQEGSPVIATLTRGSVLMASARTPDFYKVEVAGGGTGWVAANQVTEGGKVTRGGRPLVPRILFRPPLIQVADESRRSLLTTGNSFRLVARATDDNQVKDYWVYVFSSQGKRRVPGRKVTYVPNVASGSGRASVPIDLPVPLKDGVNRIVLSARDDDNLVASEEILVFRPDRKLAQALAGLTVPAEARPTAR